MTPNDFQKYSSRTLTGYIAEKYDWKVDLAGLAMGLSGEAGEVVTPILRSLDMKKFNREEMIDELGDVLWYCAAILTVNKVEFESLTFLKHHELNCARTPSLIKKVFELGKHCGEVCNYVKKVAFHDHEYDKESLIDSVQTVVWTVCDICQVIEVEISDVFDYNAEKLTKRYPDGWSSQDSIDRRR